MKLLEKHIVPAGVTEKIRLQEYAVSIFKAAPTRSSLKKAIKRGEVTINGCPAHTGDWIKEGQKIELFRQDKREIPFRLKLEIIFEDDHLAVINKPAGYPTSGNYFKTISNALSFNLKPSTQDTALATPTPVHRLDNPTSGLLIIAKTGDAQRNLHQDLAEKKIIKKYLALVHGKFPQEKTIRDPIDHKPAETKVRLIKYCKEEGLVLSLVEADLRTGRTHQIRRHLALEGYPVVGEKEYGKQEAFKKNIGLFLMSKSLVFRHPITNERIEIALTPAKKFLKIQGLQEFT